MVVVDVRGIHLILANCASILLPGEKLAKLNGRQSISSRHFIFFSCLCIPPVIRGQHRPDSLWVIFSIPLRGFGVLYWVSFVFHIAPINFAHFVSNRLTVSSRFGACAPPARFESARTMRTRYC